MVVFGSIGKALGLQNLVIGPPTVTGALSGRNEVARLKGQDVRLYKSPDRLYKAPKRLYKAQKS